MGVQGRGCPLPWICGLSALSPALIAIIMTPPGLYTQHFPPILRDPQLHVRCVLISILQDEGKGSRKDYAFPKVAQLTQPLGLCVHVPSAPRMAQAVDLDHLMCSAPGHAASHQPCSLILELAGGVWLS